MNNVTLSRHVDCQVVPDFWVGASLAGQPLRTISLFLENRERVKDNSPRHPSLYGSLISVERYMHLLELHSLACDYLVLPSKSITVMSFFRLHTAPGSSGLLTNYVSFEQNTIFKNVVMRKRRKNLSTQTSTIIAILDDICRIYMRYE